MIKQFFKSLVIPSVAKAEYHETDCHSERSEHPASPIPTTGLLHFERAQRARDTSKEIVIPSVAREPHLASKKAKRVLAPAILILLFLPFVSGCGKSSGGGDSDDSAPPAAAEPEVTVTKVVRGSVAASLAVNGNLSGPANRDAKVSALVPGRIARVLVQEGDFVHEGQVLAELGAAPLVDQQRQSEAQLAQARASAANAKASAQRNEGLLQRGIASRKEVEDARTQLAVNEAAVKQAQAALSAARNQVGRAVIRAPFAGTVVRRFLGVGDQVDGTGAQPVVEVANIDSLELLGTVPASRLSEIKPGQKFPFQTDAVPGVTFNATVVAVLPAVDPATNNGSVRIRIANPKHLLKVGQFLSIQLPVSETQTHLVVPRASIYPDDTGQPRVYRVNGTDAESVPVKLGTQSGDKAEVLSGVSEGDTVIVTGGYGLPDRSKVRVKQVISASPSGGGIPAAGESK